MKFIDDDDDDDGHFEHLQQLCPSPNLHPHFITNKLAIFRANNKLPEKTTLGMLRNGRLFS